MKTILCFGDSNTWGWDADNIDKQTGLANRFSFKERWPGIMQGILGSDFRVIEDALNGRTTSFDDPLLPHRNGLTALPLSLECHTPIDLLILMLGGNDTKIVYNASAGLITDAMDLLIQAASVRYAGGIPPKILLLCPPVMENGVATAIYGYEFGPEASKKSIELVPLYKALAKKRGCFVLDVNETGAKIGDTDYVHMKVKDHEMLGKAVAGKVKEIFTM